MAIPLTRLQSRSAFGRAGKRQQNASAWLLAFERRAEALIRDTAALRQAMAVAPGHRFNDPRYAAGTSVNATDIRASRAWQQSSVPQSDVTIIEGLPLWLTAAFDTDTISRVWPSRVRIAEPVAEGIEGRSEGKRQSRAPSVQAQRAERLRAAAGTIRMAEQD